MANLESNHYLDKFCKLISAKQYKKAEQLLLGLIEKSFSSSYRLVDRENSRTILHEVYCSFNLYYQGWLSKNNSLNDSLSEDLSLEHSNWLIGHCTFVAEMDDLLFHLLNYPDTSGKIDELEKAFNFYKQNLLKDGSSDIPQLNYE